MKRLFVILVLLFSSQSTFARIVCTASCIRTQSPGLNCDKRLRSSKLMQAWVQSKESAASLFKANCLHGSIVNDYTQVVHSIMSFRSETCVTEPIFTTLDNMVCKDEKELPIQENE